MVAVLSEGDRLFGLKDVFDPTLWWLAIPGMAICSVLRLMFFHVLVIYPTGSILEIALNAGFYAGLVIWIEFAAISGSSARAAQARFRDSWLLRAGVPLLVFGVVGMHHTTWLVKMVGWEGRDPAMSGEDVMSILLAFPSFCGGVLTVLGISITIVRKLRRRRLLSPAPHGSTS